MPVPGLSPLHHLPSVWAEARSPQTVVNEAVNVPRTITRARTEELTVNNRGPVRQGDVLRSGAAFNYDPVGRAAYTANPNPVVITKII